MNPENRKRYYILLGALIALTVYFYQMYVKGYLLFGLKFGNPTMDYITSFLVGLSSSIITVAVIISTENNQPKNLGGKPGFWFALLDFMISVLLLIPNNIETIKIVKDGVEILEYMPKWWNIAGAFTYSILMSSGLFYISELFANLNINELIEKLKTEIKALTEKAQLDLEAQKLGFEKRMLELKEKHSLDLDEKEKHIQNLIRDLAQRSREMNQHSEQGEVIISDLETKIHHLEQRLSIYERLIAQNPLFESEKSLKSSISNKITRFSGGEDEKGEVKQELITLAEIAQKRGYDLNGTIEKIKGF